MYNQVTLQDDFGISHRDVNNPTTTLSQFIKLHQGVTPEFKPFSTEKQLDILHNLYVFIVKRCRKTSD